MEEDFEILSRQSASPRGARGLRAYAIGDVHGRLDLLDRLLTAIHDDLVLRPARKALLLFVGDLIDRGPSSAQVLERVRTYRRPGVRTVFLLGNHEEVLLRILGGDSAPIASWLKFGGAECIASYGADPQGLAQARDADVLAEVRRVIPRTHVEFLQSFADTCRFGDYLFVHAGIRPGVELDLQQQSDLRWIRAPFLLDGSDHGFVVVHGHTITKGVDEQPNRIGIDTGAYRSGVLTALAIEGERRWYLDTASAAVDAA